MGNATKVYELKEDAGPHKLRGEDEDGNPINEAMQPGDRVRSAKPLSRLFPNKFTCIDDAKKKVATRGPLTEPVRPSGTRKNKPVEDDGDAEIAEVFDPDVDHETTDDEEMEAPMTKAAKVEKGKAAKALKRAAKKAGEVQNDAAEPEQVDDDEVPEADAGEGKGKDVTEDVDGAAEKDLKVFFRERHYFVYDGDSPDAPLNDEPFTKAKLGKFVATYQG